MRKVWYRDCKIHPKIEYIMWWIKLFPPIPKFRKNAFHTFVGLTATKQPPNAACIKQPLHPRWKLDHGKFDKLPSRSYIHSFHFDWNRVAISNKKCMTFSFCIFGIHLRELAKNLIDTPAQLHLPSGKLHNLHTRGLSRKGRYTQSTCARCGFEMAFFKQKNLTAIMPGCVVE